MSKIEEAIAMAKEDRNNALLEVLVPLRTEIAMLVTVADCAVRLDRNRLKEGTANGLICGQLRDLDDAVQAAQAVGVVK